MLIINKIFGLSRIYLSFSYTDVTYNKLNTVVLDVKSLNNSKKQTTTDCNSQSESGNLIRSCQIWISKE